MTKDDEGSRYVISVVCVVVQYYRESFEGCKKKPRGDTQTIFCISHILLVMYCQTSLFLYVLPSYEEADLLSPGIDVGK